LIHPFDTPVAPDCSLPSVTVEPGRA
jgi:hypothetical protein